jgi:adenosylcobinamide-phosphate synthase
LVAIVHSEGIGLSVFAIVVALILDFALGDPALRWHPVRVLGFVIEALEVVCRRLPISPKAQGTVFVMLNMAAFLVPASIIMFCASFSRPFTIASGGLMIYFALGGTCLAREVSGVARSLINGGLNEGRARLKMLVSRDVDAMQESEIASSAIETLSENFSDSACATLFYAALGGPILAWAHRAANTLDAMVGYKTEEYADFGWASAKLDDIVNFVPARISVLFIALASPAIGGSVRAALDRAASDGALLPSPNSGYPIAAFAGALGLKLCGPTSYFGVLKEKPFLGEGRRPRVLDIMAALELYWNAYALAAVSTVALSGIMLL